MNALSSDHWPLRRLKLVAEVIPSGVDKKATDGERPVRLCNYMDVYNNERITGDLSFMQATASNTEIARLGLQQHDVVVTKDSESPQDIAVPALVERSAEGVVCGYHLAILRPDRACTFGPYLFWALKTPEVSSQFSVRAQGVTRFGLSVGGMGDVLVPFPPLDEQARIAAFLDSEVSEIDRVVEAALRVVSTLEEKRVSLATLAIDELAATWPKRRLWSVLRNIEQGWSPQADDRRIVGEEWGVLKLSAVKRGRFFAVEHKALPSRLDPEPSLEVKDGDVLLSRANTLPFVGDACLVDKTLPKLMFSDLLFRLVPDESQICPEYLALWLLTQDARRQIEADARGSSLSMVKISRTHVRDWRLPLPPLAEQRKVASKVAAIQESITRALQTAEAMVSALREKRVALISAAVNGRMPRHEAQAARSKLELA